MIIDFNKMYKEYLQKFLAVDIFYLYDKITEREEVMK